MTLIILWKLVMLDALNVSNQCPKRVLVSNLKSGEELNNSKSSLKPKCFSGLCGLYNTSVFLKKNNKLLRGRMMMKRRL